MSDKKPNPNTVRIDLAFPLEISGVKTDFLTMRRPKLRDRIAAQTAAPDNQGMQSAHLVASICEVPVDDILDMDGGDFTAVENVLQDFLQPPPRR